MEQVDYFSRQQFDRRQGATVSEVVDAAGGLYGMSPTCYLQLVARCHSFRRTDLDAELYERRRLVRIRALRGSLFLVPRPFVDVVAAASKRQVTRGFRSMLMKSIGAARYDTWSARVESVLAGRDLSVVAIKADLELTDDDVADSLKYVVALMAAEGRLIRANVTGTWRSNRFTYARWEDWLGQPATSFDEAQAHIEIARWYLGAFGPATLDDFRWWSGLSKTAAAKAFAALGLGAGMVDLATPPRLDGERGLRLLPIWDTALVGHVDRSRIVPEALFDQVYDASGNATSVVLVDGVVAGIWQLDGTEALEVAVAPFVTWRAAAWDEVEAEAERIRAAVEAEAVVIRRVDVPPPLRDRPRNAFMRPLSGP